MKLFLTNALLWFALVSSGQTPIGMGLVSVNFEDSSVFYFYKDTTDFEAAKTIRPIRNLVYNSLILFSSHSAGFREHWFIPNPNNESQWLKPEDLDPYSIVFRCKQQTKDWFEVIVNEQTNQTYWLKKSKLTYYFNWEEYLKSKRGISRLSASNQDIKRKPSEKSRRIKYSGSGCFGVRSMNGDWIEIFRKNYLRNYSEGSEENKKKLGWIRWRNGDSLLINYKCDTDVVRISDYPR